jgi:beta-lactamase regulating signal transducer with metallopeptidase domain
MQGLLQSAFLQALGYAIFNSLWQMSLLWIVVMVVNSVGRLSSAKKYFTGVIAQFAGFVWFLFTLNFYYNQCSEAIATAQAVGAADSNYYFYEASVNNFSSGFTYTIIKIEQLLPYLSVAYLFMLLFLSVRLTRAYIYTKDIRTNGLVKPDVEWKLFVKRTAGYLGINKDVCLYFSEIVKSPLTLGFAKPLILIPVASLNHLSPDQLEAILLHELAHIKRADYLINIIQSIVEIILFFNPFTQLLGKFIKKERENSCDDWVLQFQYKPAIYADALLRIAYIQTEPSFALQAASGNKGELLPRVKRMLNQQEKKHQYRNHLFALLLITVMLTTVAWFNPSANKKAAVDTTANNNKKVLVEPFTAKVDNPLFNPIYYFITDPLKESVAAAIKSAAKNVSVSAPVIKETFDKVTPIAMESIQKAYEDVSDEIPVIKEDAVNALADAKSQIADIKINGISIRDSVALKSSISHMVQLELSKIDWNKMNDEVAGAQMEINNETENVVKDLVNQKKINSALSEVSTQLNLFNDQTKTFEFSNFLKSYTDKKQSTNDQQEKIKDKTRKAVTAARPLRIWSDMKRDDYSLDITTDALSSLTPGNAPQTSLTYSSVNYDESDPGNVNDSDSTTPAPDSAIVVVQHNPDNDKSHVKHITVQLIGDNGVVKTYTITVDVYQ